MYEAYDLARSYERRNDGHRNFAKHSNQLKLVGSNSHQFSSKSSPSPAYNTKQSSLSNRLELAGHHKVAGTSTGRKILSDSEFEARRARNQCYWCDAPYTKGHNCRKNDQLMVMEVVPDDGEQSDSDDTSDDGVNKQLVEVPPIINIEEPLIRLQVLAYGNSTSNTMQLKGKFGKKMVHVLIDSGVTHNFVHPS